MNYFLKFNKTLIIYSLILFIFIPVFGIHVLINFFSNILIILFLVPLLILLVMVIAFNSYKSRISTCNNCGAISLVLSDNCMNCGAELKNITKKNELEKNPSESTIEVKAEEIK